MKLPDNYTRQDLLDDIWTSILLSMIMFDFVVIAKIGGLL